MQSIEGDSIHSLRWNLERLTWESEGLRFILVVSTWHGRIFYTFDFPFLLFEQPLNQQERVLTIQQNINYILFSIFSKVPNFQFKTSTILEKKFRLGRSKSTRSAPFGSKENEARKGKSKNRLETASFHKHFRRSK